MRSSSCSMLAIAVGGPPHCARNSLWIMPWGLLVRWFCSATRVFSSLRSLVSCSRTESWGRSAGATGGADAAALRWDRVSQSFCRWESRVRTWSGSSRPGRPR
jgi:hypothetical protein